MKNLNISAIIPVYNEEDSVGDVIAGLISQMSGMGIDYEIIAVNDGSTDGFSGAERENN